MKRYSKYVLVDIPWYREIPAHWDCYRGKRLFNNPKEKNVGNKEKNLLSLTLGGVIKNDADNPIGLSPADYATYQIFAKNDLVFKMIDLENVSTSRVGIVPERGIMSSAYIRFVARESINARYFFFQYYSWWLQNIFNGLGAGVRQTLSSTDLINLKIAIPPSEEQDQIVRYLDWKISKINELIHRYQKEIQLLEERRQTVIDFFVTHGVDNALLKTEASSWMGNIPVHWKMVPAKRLFVESRKRRIQTDIPATASQKYGIISQADYMQKEQRRIVVANQGLEDWKHVEKNNFVISLRSFQGGIERSNITCCVTWHYIVLVPQKYVQEDYFKWLLKSKHYIKALQGTSDFIRDGQDLRFSNFVRIDLPLIPKEEQQRIASFIEKSVTEIENIIPSVHKKISLLREYRTRLISDVVTGQVDVREIKVPDYVPSGDTSSYTYDHNGNSEEVSMDAD